MNNLEEILAIIFIFGGGSTMVVLLRWLHHRSIDARVRIQADLYKQLLDKFGSGRELAEFLETESGKRAFQNLGSAEANPRARVLKGITSGVVVTFVGLAMVTLSIWQRGMIFPGIIILGAGLGGLIAAGISYRLSRKWGLMKEEEPNVANQVRG